MSVVVKGVRHWKGLVLAASLCGLQPLVAVALSASELSVILHTKSGDQMVIGTLHMTPRDGGHGYRLDLDESKFEDHFLSMRPFKCLPHPQQMLCHLPYPYEIRRFISTDDLADLEYDLLFLHKTPTEYGINAWNGLYFELTMTDKGFTGQLRETDLNVLAAPPEDGDLRPIVRSELYEASDTHWPAKLTIE